MTNNFIKAMNNTAVTTNGCAANYTTFSACLNFFYECAASRNKNLSDSFSAALSENRDVAIATLLYLRDIREGQGERKKFFDLIKIALPSMSEAEVKELIADKVPSLGRFKDLAVFFDTPYKYLAANVWTDAIAQGNGLAAKWAPRKDKKGAYLLRRAVNMTEAQWRHYVVPKSSTVEQKMCAKKWHVVEYPHVPSKAMQKYSRAFKRNDTDRFEDYLQGLKNGTQKVNAGAVYPYEVIKLFRTDSGLANAQWNAMPDFIQSDASFLPIVDVSPSMDMAVQGSITAKDIAISLGIYLSDRNKSSFKNAFMTFSEKPTLEYLTGSLSDKYAQLRKADWGMTTDLEALFTLVLDKAVQENLAPEEMPSNLIIISDMQFNRCIKVKDSAFTMINKKYTKAGYPVPQLVFWNVNSPSSFPATMYDDNVALVSGFSPSIMKNLLNNKLNPVQAMLDTVLVPRYTFGNK